MDTKKEIIWTLILYIIFTIIICYLIGCTATTAMEPEPEPDKPSEKFIIPVTYQTNAHHVDVIYCRPDGSLGAVFGTYKFDTTFYFESKSQVCLSASKLRENNNIDVFVSIKSGDSILFENTGEMEASISGYLK